MATFINDPANPVTITVTPVGFTIEVETTGPAGDTGPAGIGVPAGGSTGQVLAKASATDYATEWANQTGGAALPIAQSDVTGLVSDLSGKAATVHTHIIGDTTGLQGALDGKQAAGSYAAASHAHIIGDVTGLQSAIDGKASIVNATHAVYVSKTGLDTDNGLSEAKPVLTIGAAITAANALITGGATGVAINVLDGGTYTESFTVAGLSHLVAPAATVVGGITLESNASVTLHAHYASENNQNLVNKSGGTGIGYYVANRLDGRGTGGALTGVQCLRNVSNGSVLFARVGVCWVGTNGIGIGDAAGSFGHIHFWTADLYLAGNGAVGISATGPSTDIIGFIDHILETGSPTGTTGIVVSHANAIVKATITEIRATLGTAYNVSAGALHLVAARIVGTKTGSATFELLTALDGKQATLVSGTTIKTINGDSVLGSGDLVVTGGAVADDSITNAKLANMAANTVKVRAAATTGDPSDLPIAASQLIGRGASGDMAAIALDASLEMTGATLGVVGTPVSSFTSGVYVDADDFGVVRNNAVDSRAALQTALDSISTTGGTVYLKGNTKNPGAYSLSGPVFFNGSNQRILGAGKESTFISTLGPAFVTGLEPYRWPSQVNYVDTDTTLTVACRDGGNLFIMDGRYREAITGFATGGTYEAGGSGQPTLEMTGVPTSYTGFRTRGVTKVHFPGHPLATASNKTGFTSADTAGWELFTGFTLNLIYFAHGGKINGGVIGTGQGGGPDPWILTGQTNTGDFYFYLAMTNDKLFDRTQLQWQWPQPATNGLHRLTIQIDLTPGAERLDVWQDRVKVATTPQNNPTNNWITTLVADRLKAPFNIIAPWQHKDFTLGSDSYQIGSAMQAGSQSDYTIVGFAGFSETMFSTVGALGDTGATLTRIDAATVTDGNTALPTATVYENSMACLGTTATTGYDVRTFARSLFSTWGMICPHGNGPPGAAVNVVIEGIDIIGQANQNNGDGISTLPTLGLHIKDCNITSGFFNSIGGFEGLISYPFLIEKCDFGALGNHVLIAGNHGYISECRFLYIGRRAITSSGSFVKIVNSVVNEYKSNAEGFFASFPGRSVGSGVYASCILINQEGPRTTPKIATWRIHASYDVQSNDVILDRVDMGSTPAVPTVLIDASFPPGQRFSGRVEIKNCNWAPSAPGISIRGTALKGYANMDRTACQQEVVQIPASPFAAFAGFRPETVSPVITRHNDFESIPNLGGWLPKSHEVTMPNAPEGGVRVWGVKTGGTEGSNTPPVWEPTEFQPSRNVNALSGNIQSTLHVRVSASHPSFGSPITLFSTFINDTQSNLILQRVLTGSATFDRTNLQAHYEFGQQFINASFAGSAVTSSAAVTNDGTFWNAASGGQKTNAAALPLVSTGLLFTYPEMARVRSSFLLGIGSGGTPTIAVLGRTNYTTRAFLIDGTYNLAIGDIVAANSVREGSWTNYIQDRVLDYVFGNGSPTIPATFWFGLSTTPVNADGTGITEPSGGSYERIQLNPTSTNFGAHDEYLSTWSNKLPIAFAAPTGAWGTCIYWFISDALTSGNILAKGPLNRPVSPVTGQQAPTFYARSLQIQI